MKLSFSILFEDKHLVVIGKPAGLLSVPDRFDADLPNVKHLLRDQYGDIRVVHRLDRDTSGVMVFAKTEDAQRHLSSQFMEQEVKKVYWALVHGVVSESGTIDFPLAPDPSRLGKMRRQAKGKPAQTDYMRLATFTQYSLVALYPRTGRTHQLRVHLQGIGHPIVADPLYGDGQPFFLSNLKGKKYRTNRTGAERPLLSRLALHAQELRFIHPLNEEVLIYTMEPPKDMRAVVKQLEKWG